MVLHFIQLQELLIQIMRQLVIYDTLFYYSFKNERRENKSFKNDLLKD